MYRLTPKLCIEVCLSAAPLLLYPYFIFMWLCLDVSAPEPLCSLCRCVVLGQWLQAGCEGGTLWYHSDHENIRYTKTYRPIRVTETMRNLHGFDACVCFSLLHFCGVECISKSVFLLVCPFPFVKHAKSGSAASFQRVAQVILLVCFYFNNVKLSKTTVSFL